MGNKVNKNKKEKDNIKMIYESKDIIPKEIKNRFLKRNIKKSDLTQQELEILKC